MVLGKFQAVLLFGCVYSTYGSAGDRSLFFRICIGKCFPNCSDVSEPGRVWEPLVWGCQDECKYACMWKTVNAYLKFGLQVPQFYGKWPFVRWLGLQEPASAVFSLLNLASHALMLRRFVTVVPRQAPLYWLWVSYGLVCVNGWFWSTIFHARDTKLTEKMDYLCAFSMVLFSTYSALIRILGKCTGSRAIIVSASCLLIFLLHTAYMCFVEFSYSYNMIINLIVGGTNTILWLSWCAVFRHRWKHVRKCATSVVMLTMSVLLETADFAPVLWLLDAHALWHLITAPLPIIWYSFLIDDSLVMLEGVPMKKLL